MFISVKTRMEQEYCGNHYAIRGLAWCLYTSMEDKILSQQISPRRNTDNTDLQNSKLRLAELSCKKGAPKKRLPKSNRYQRPTGEQRQLAAVI